MSITHTLFRTDSQFVKLAESIKHLQNYDTAEADRAAMTRARN